jgi:alkylation response protein AidB-like acyl-CoA dehydrogenase
MNDLSSPVGKDYLARARDIAPLIAESSGAIEGARRLTPNVVKALTGGGFYRMLQPKFLGGGELPIAAFCEVIEEIAKADASTAWCLAQCSTCAMAAAYLDRNTALKLFGPAEGIVAWGPPAPSEARMVPGGYRVTGKWNFASGGHQARWLGGQSFVTDADGHPMRRPDGAPVIRMMLFPYDAADISDVWHVIGLKGTGSDTYAVKDLFVPEQMSFARDEEVDRRENGLLFRFSTSNIYSFGFAAVALGIARQVLDDATRMATDKTPGGSKRALKDNNVVQAHIGRSEARLRAARTYLYKVARDLWHAMAENPELTLDQKIEIRMVSTHAIHEAGAVVDALYHMLGSTAVFRQYPFERRFRDMHTAMQQLQGRESNYETIGQVLLGITPDAMLFTT